MVYAGRHGPGTALLANNVAIVSHSHPRSNVVPVALARDGSSKLRHGTRVESSLPDGRGAHRESRRPWTQFLRKETGITKSAPTSEKDGLHHGQWWSSVHQWTP